MLRYLFIIKAKLRNISRIGLILFAAAVIAMSFSIRYGAEVSDSLENVILAVDQGISSERRSALAGSDDVSSFSAFSYGSAEVRTDLVYVDAYYYCCDLSIIDPGLTGNGVIINSLLDSRLKEEFRKKNDNDNNPYSLGDLTVNNVVTSVIGITDDDMEQPAVYVPREMDRLFIVQGNVPDFQGYGAVVKNYETARKIQNDLKKTVETEIINNDFYNEKTKDKDYSLFYVLISASVFLVSLVVIYNSVRYIYAELADMKYMGISGKDAAKITALSVLTGIVLYGIVGILVFYLIIYFSGL